MEDVSYHIYAKDKVLYCNLPQDDFEEKWQLLNVMVGLLKTEYTRKYLSYIKLAPKAGIGGPGRVIHKQEWEEDSY